jgi:hypothetical protein
MPEYAKHKAAVDQLFAGWKGSVTLVPSLEVKGEFAIHFEPLKADTKMAEPHGWSLTTFTEAMKGLGVEFTLVQEGQ